MEINKTEVHRSRIIISSLVMLGIIITVVLVVMFWGDADGDGENSDSFFGILFNDEKAPTISDPLRGGVIVGEDSAEEGEEMMLYQISAEPVVGAALSPDGGRCGDFTQTGAPLPGNVFFG